MKRVMWPGYFALWLKVLLKYGDCFLNLELEESRIDLILKQS